MNLKKLQDEVLYPSSSTVINYTNSVKDTKCRVRLLSDLHFEGGEHKELYKSRGEDILVLAGDIHVGAEKEWTTLKRFAEEQPNIVYVMGNHTFYRQDYFDTVRKLEDWAKYTSIKILNPGTVYYDPKLKRLQEHDKEDSPAILKDRTYFIGGTLWTNFRDNELSKFHASRGINDFRLIEYDNHYFTPNDAANLFRQQFGYIKHQYEELKCKKVIVTHFLPATECIDPQYLGNATSTLNDYFANDLSSWIDTLEDTTWLHGHTHSLVDVTIGTTRIVASPYGYGKNYNYKECLLEI